MVEAEGGERIVVDENWTDGPGGNENEEQPEACPHLLDYEGLVQVAELIERIKGRQPKKTNQTKEGDYDGGHQKVENPSEVQS